MSKGLDILNLKILPELKKNGRISIKELSKKMGMSRPTSSSWLKRLLDSGLVSVMCGLKLREIGGKMAYVVLKIKNEDARREIKKTRRKPSRIRWLESRSSSSIPVQLSDKTKL